MEQRQGLILGLLWQILKRVVTASVNIKSYPQLIRLLKDGETIDQFLKLKPEDILLRWFNFHLKNAGHDKEITNFHKDVEDSTKYTILLNQLNKECSTNGLNESDLSKRAQRVLDNSKKLGVDPFISPTDIVKGNEKLNTLFTAAIFNHCHGLDPPTKEEQDTYEKAGLLSEGEGTREERSYRMWMNSLGIDDVYVNNLYDDSESGILLLKVFDRISPGTVNWNLVDKSSKNKFTKIVNCNECIEAAKKCKFHIVGIGGVDIHDRNKKAVLAVVWQMMRYHTLAVLGNKTEDFLLKWANDLTGRDPKISSFMSKDLKDSLFFIDIMAKMEPRVIDWDLINKGIFKI
jgi:plastin-1